MESMGDGDRRFVNKGQHMLVCAEVDAKASSRVAPQNFDYSVLTGF